MSLQLIAFDFGTTTSKAIVAEAALVRNAITGRTEIQTVKTIARPEPVFTPFAENADILDEARISELVERWLPEAAQGPIAGGVIITGLAAKKQNAATIAEAVRRRIGETVIAVADDPGQESWLAFMGSIAGLSAAHPETRFLNFDIGGGTTNLALGANKTVSATGSLWVGARHFKFAPGTYDLLGVSPYGEKVLKTLGLKTVRGAEDARRIADFYVAVLEKIALGQNLKGLRFLEQLRFPKRPQGPPPVATFSGGVGEVVYRLNRGESFSTTAFGDLGVDLAHAILRSPVLAGKLAEYIPQNLGRATVSGLAFHGVEVSGSTTFVRRRDILPLRHLPLLGRISPAMPQAEIDRLIARVLDSGRGACLQAVFDADVKGEMENLAGRLARALRKNRFPKGIPLIIFMPQNLGKTFGHYATEWGRLAADLLVIDEIESDVIEKKAYFAAINPCAGANEHADRGQNMLVSFYGGLDHVE